MGKMDYARGEINKEEYQTGHFIDEKVSIMRKNNLLIINASFIAERR